MNLTNVTDLMREQFLEREMSFDEHQTYAPVIDELTFYAKCFYEAAADGSVDFDQANTLMRFGSAFQVEDLSYWRMTRDLMDKSLDSQNIDLETILSSSTHMKEFGLLSNKMLRKVASYLPQAS